MATMNSKVAFLGAAGLVALSTAQADPNYKATILSIPPGYSSATIYGAYGNLLAGVGVASDGNDHALSWTGSAPTDLSPSGSDYSHASGSYSNCVVGHAGIAGNDHAFLWSNGQAIDLNPSGADHSQAKAASANTQVGYSGPYGNEHATAWTGTSASAKDLNPSGYDSSFATSIDGSSIVGYALGSSGAHAIAWNNFVATDINPFGFDSSTAQSVFGSAIAGYGQINGATHALVWNGTTATDLNPSGFDYSLALGVSAIGEVGYGSGSNATLGNNHAMLWLAGSNKANDLGALLPSGYYVSTANAIDPITGSIYGTARDLSGNILPVVWQLQAVPEPASALALLSGVLLIGGKRRRNAR